MTTLHITRQRLCQHSIAPAACVEPGEKNVIRYALSGLHHGHRRLLSPLEKAICCFGKRLKRKKSSYLSARLPNQVLQQNS